MSREEFKSAFEYIHGSEKDLEEQSQHYESVFQARTPGTSALTEVQAEVNLGQWKVRWGSRFVNLEVKISLTIPSSERLTFGYRTLSVGKRMKYQTQGPLNVSPQSWQPVLGQS